ncbi:hypothetical protein [Aureimonas altamirensis]|uniref:hypothetical protein n=1 Tax=Aureimonas altamirensis TaxID=370622 RepID=UPI000AFC37E6|nr:hypothetical protein [Aureimonas altamirensis]
MAAKGRRDAGWSEKAAADEVSVGLTRAVNGQVMTGRVLITDPVIPGDTIMVRDRF